MFLHENNRNYNSYSSSYKLAFILFHFYPLLKNKSKNQQELIVLLQSHSKFYELLQRNLMTFYSCLYYTCITQSYLSRVTLRKSVNELVYELIKFS